MKPIKAQNFTFVTINRFMRSSKLLYKTVYMKTMNLIFLHVDELHIWDQFVKQHNLWIGNANACNL